MDGRRGSLSPIDGEFMIKLKKSGYMQDEQANNNKYKFTETADIDISPMSNIGGQGSNQFIFSRNDLNDLEEDEFYRETL